MEIVAGWEELELNGPGHPSNFLLEGWNIFSLPPYSRYERGLLQSSSVLAESRCWQYEMKLQSEDGCQVKKCQEQEERAKCV